MQCNRRHPENGRAYLQEIVFGLDAGQYRAASLEITERLQHHIERVLVDTGTADKADAEPHARLVFSVTFMQMVAAPTAAAAGPEALPDEIDRQLATHFAAWGTPAGQHEEK